MYDTDRVRDSAITPLLVTFASVFLLTLALVRVRRSAKGGGLRPPPRLPSLPIVGSLLFMRCLGLFHRYFMEKSKTLGPVFTCYLGSKLALVLNDRKSIHEALVKRSASYSDRQAFYTIQFYYNTNLKGIIYRRYDETFRKYHQQKLSILKDFGLGKSLMEERILLEIDELMSLIDARKGVASNFKLPVTLCTLNVVASILFGRRVSQTDPALVALAQSVNDFLHKDSQPVHFCPPLRYIPYYKRVLESGFEYMDGEFRFIKNGIRQSLEPGSPESFVKSCVEKDGPGYDEEDLQYVCRDLIEAGTDTSSTTVLWALVELANHPRIQKRLQDEVDSVLVGGRQPSMSDTAAMPYLEATILELLRIHPPVPLALPHRSQGDTELCGYDIPSGIMVLPNIYAVHMNRDEWVDPEVFRPERFLDESEQQVVGRNRVIVFGLGRRSCLGEAMARTELFLILSSFVKHYHIRPPEGHDRVTCSEKPGVIVSPSDFDVRLIPREP